MTSGVTTWVKSLGDFPLDPDRGKAWLWSGDGTRLLWQSAEAAQALGINAGPQTTLGVTHDNALRSFAAELTGLYPDRQPIRVKMLPLSHGRTSGTFTCLCRHVALSDGSGFGLLTVDIGALPRLARSEPAVATPVEPPQPPAMMTQSEPVPGGVSAGAVSTGAVDLRPAALERPARAMPKLVTNEAVKVDAGAVAMAPPPAPPAAVPEKPIVPSAPTWITIAPDQRRPLRFVWQTDSDGRFAHVSRELAEAVGPSQTAILGRSILEAAGPLGLQDAKALAAQLAGEETFTPVTVLWPADRAEVTVPVEFAGMPVRENGAFVGFRGYGIARIDRIDTVPIEPAKPKVSDTHTDIAQAKDQLAQDKEAHDAASGEDAPTAITAKTEREQPRPTVELKPSPPVAAPEEPASNLSTSERNAFREIARVLGTKIEPQPAAPPAVEDDKPPLTPRQMPAWIARRQQARQASEQDAEVRPEQAETNEPSPAVVPLEAFQTRLDKRAREGATQLVTNLLDRLPLAALVLQKGKAAYANPSFLALAGYPDFQAFLAAGGADAFFSGPIDGMDQRDPGTLLVRRSDGVSFSTEAQVTSLSWEDAPATLTTFRPTAITAAEASRVQKAEAALARAQAELQELRFVLDTATDGVLSLDTEGRILAANRSAEALFGFDKREIIGEPLTALLEPESHATALDYLQGLKADGVATIMNDGRDVVGRERHGGRIPLSMTLGRLGGDEARFCAVLRDVTIWKKSEAELTSARRAAESANANKSDFLARMSHEIRTPMNAIIGFADVMRNETFGPVGNERYKGYVNDIHASGVHVVSLVNDLLDLSKVAAGKLDLTFGSVDLNAVVVETVSMMQPQANASSVIMRTQLAQKLPPVVGDQRSLRQIMLNLLSNAAKFTEAGGQVVVTTMLTDKGEAVIRVRDSGVGMTVEEVARAMEPFRQIPGPKSEGGTGLGLPLTKALAEANRAAFTITSEPGKGTLAEVVFPATRVLAE